MKRPLGWPPVANSQRELAASCVLLSVLTLWGCSDARLISSSSEGQTKIRVLPEAFIGDVPCARGSVGGLELYVVQLQDVSSAGAADAGIETTTSPPVPCDRSVTFAAVPFRLYAADILGFDRAIEPQDIDSVEPRWTASCGRGNPSISADAGVDPLGPTLASRGQTVPLRGCTSFGGAASLSELAVDVAGALGQLRCGDQPGEVLAVEAVLDGVRRRASCGDPLSFTITRPGRFHTIDLYGYELSGDAGAGMAEAGPLQPAPEAGASSDAGADAAQPDDAADAAAEGAVDAASDAAGGDAATAAPSGEPVWRTRCTGRSLAGLRRTATCEPFERIAP
jgi:hypothetical protein